jgi:hypothetical protein
MAAGAAAAAAAAAIANAIKASGVLIRVTPEDFSKILGRAEAPLVVVAEGGFFTTNYQYLMSYKGLTFYCKSGEPLPLPDGVETIMCQSIWIPG